jgi:hypothetical protein
MTIPEEFGDLWEMDADWRCITTNGYIRSDGGLVMGRGCALQAKRLYPDLQQKLGARVKRDGNHVHAVKKHKLITFPVKHVWNEQADPALILRSMKELIWYHAEFDLGRVLLPRPGCGNGGLSWEGKVKPLLHTLIDHWPDDIVIVSYPEKSDD